MPDCDLKAASDVKRLMVAVAVMVAGIATVAIAHNTSVSQCGINALYSNMLHLGTAIPLEVVYEAIETNSDGEVNLYELARFAREHGIFVKGVEVPSADIIKKELKPNTGVILQFDYDAHGREVRHVAALLRSESNEVMYVDVPLAKIAISDEQLKALTDRSHGMLVLSSTPFSRLFYLAATASTRPWYGLIVVSFLVAVVSGWYLWKNGTMTSRSTSQS